MIVFRRFAAPLPVVFVAAFAAGAAYAQECKQRRDLNAIHGVEVAAGSNEAFNPAHCDKQTAKEAEAAVKKTPDDRLP